MTSIIERVITSAPVDTLARIVTSKAQEIYKFTCNDATLYHSDLPPDMKPPPKKAPFFRDLTGHKIGWFTVVGYVGKISPRRNRNQRTLWAVKCVCGKYEMRGTKTLKINKHPEYTKCRECLKLDKLRDKILTAQNQ